MKIKIIIIQEAEEEVTINSFLKIKIEEKTKSRYKFLHSIYIPQLKDEIEQGIFRVKLYFEDYG